MTLRRDIQSWGRLPEAEHSVYEITDRCAPLPNINGAGSCLPHGLGRSYGDSCLNDQGALLLTSRLDRFIRFNANTRELTCEAGISLATILDHIVPHGYFLPVSPGTKFVTLGGAIANDIHGKNHHRAGTFGRHVTELELLRSDGSRMRCSPKENPEWFRATIGGLGLTGLITQATIVLKPIHNPQLEVEHIKFANLAEFFERARESDASHEHTVAWVDCLARGDKLGRGIFMRGNHAPADRPGKQRPKSSGPSIPISAPRFLLNPLTMKLFNLGFYHKQWRRQTNHLMHYEPFFYPLDSVGNWNRLYGKQGFFQYQCVVPFEGDDRAIREIFETISASRQGSFLAVLKVFGGLPSPGLLSFPMPGVTLALDFPNRGERSLALFEKLDAITAHAGGRVYPAKDARMSPARFRRYFPNHADLLPFVDPAFSSSFWRRVQSS